MLASSAGATVPHVGCSTVIAPPKADGDVRVSCRLMRAVQLDFADPEFPASLIEVDDPDLPGPAWARVQVTTGGICGSDLHLFTHNTGPSPTLASIGTFPFVLGHE